MKKIFLTLFASMFLSVAPQADGFHLSPNAPHVNWGGETFSVVAFLNQATWAPYWAVVKRPVNSTDDGSWVAIGNIPDGYNNTQFGAAWDAIVAADAQTCSVVPDINSTSLNARNCAAQIQFNAVLGADGMPHLVPNGRLKKATPR